MKWLLGLTVALSLCLVPHTRAEQATCFGIQLQMGQDGHSTSPWHWIMEVHNAVGPYIIYFSHQMAPVAYKGCILWPAAPQLQFGPFVGDIVESFETPNKTDIDGHWQVLSATQASNHIHFIAQ